MSESPIQAIQRIFETRGSGRYGLEAVTQLQHALQSATLATEEKAPSSLITSALLHDIGHIFDSETPHHSSPDQNLDDQHEYRANGWIRQHFGPQVADPIRLHVLAKRYLCTIQPDYASHLSPTSHKSYLDQGGPMSPEERSQFEQEPHYPEAIKLRKWDDLGKDPNRETPPLTHFIPTLESCLLT